MNTETELKYKINSSVLKITDEEDANKQKIYQTYLNLTNDHHDEIKKLFDPSLEIDFTKIVECRLRKSTKHEFQKMNTLHYLTLKSDGDLTRTEYETILLKEHYDHLFNSIKHIGSIKKTRFTKIVELDANMKIEIDVYEDKLNELIIAEIEYKKDDYLENEITDIVKSYFGNDIENVTYDKKFKNRNLATS